MNARSSWSGPGRLIAIDNVLWHGRVIDPNRERRGYAGQFSRD